MENPVELQISVYVRQSNTGGQLQLNQTLSFPACDFSGFARILSRFHELAAQIKAEQELADRIVKGRGH